MSYCRFGEADAYIYMTYTGFDCCGCSLEPSTLFEPEGEFDVPFSAKFTTAREMLDHIAQHREAGHHIPDDVDLQIMSEYPDPDASVVETDEEREQRLIDSAPQRERIRTAMKKAYEESRNDD